MGTAGAQVLPNDQRRVLQFTMASWIFSGSQSKFFLASSCYLCVPTAVNTMHDGCVGVVEGEGLPWCWTWHSVSCDWLGSSETLSFFVSQRLEICEFCFCTRKCWTLPCFYQYLRTIENHQVNFPTQYLSITSECLEFLSFSSLSCPSWTSVQVQRIESL